MLNGNQTNSDQFTVRSTLYKSVHRCAHCGAIVEREDVTEDAMITGVFGCHECGRSGPLNVVAIETH